MGDLDTSSLVIGLILGLLVGIPVGWALSQLTPRGKIIERNSQGDIVAILPA
ncbi:MAG: hypothetical protein ACTSV7_06845 [Candidatus Baldrarchaeia archaeon]